MIAAAQSRNGPVSPFDTDSGAMIYTVDLGNGHVVDIEGPPNATPEQLQQVVASNPQLASSAVSPSADGAGLARLDNGGTEYEGGFADQLPDQASSHLAPEDQAKLIGLLQNQRWNDAKAFVESKGFTATNLDDVIKAYQQTGAINPDVNYQLAHKDSSIGGALARGAEQGVSVGLSDEIGGIVAAGKALANGDDPAAAYDRSVDDSRAQLGADQQDHAIASFVGNVVGSGVLPFGLEKSGITMGLRAIAGDAYRAARLEGFTANEARAIAAKAVSRRVATEGGAYGTAYGTDTGNTPQERLTGGLIGGVTGALGGLATNAAGNAVSRIFRNRAAGKAAETAADATEDYITPSASPGQAGAIAARYGIKPTPATTGGALSVGTQVGLSSLPGAKQAIGAAAEREAGSLGGAVSDIARSIGLPTTPEGAGSAIAGGAEDYAKASGAQARELYGVRDSAFGGAEAPVRATNTENALAGLKAKYPNNPQVAELFQHASLQRLSQAAPDNADHEWSLGEATDALSYVRGVLRAMDSNPNANAKVTTNIRTIKNAIESDVNDAAAAADQFNASIGKPANAVSAQRAADKFYADRSAALNGALKTPLASAKNPIKVSGERVYAEVIRNAQRKGGNLKSLRDAWFRLPDEAKSTFAATAIDDMGRAMSSNQDAAHSAWSYETFLTNFDKMAPQAQRIMFGADAAKQLADIASYASRLRKTNRLRNFSNTAHGLLSATLLGTIGLGIIHGDAHAAGEALATAAAGYGGAKLFLSTAAMRQWTRSALRSALKSDPVQREKSAASLISGLTSIARKNPAIAGEVLKLRQNLTDTLSGLPATVAANPGGNASSDADRGNAVGAGQQNQQELRP